MYKEMEREKPKSSKRPTRNTKKTRTHEHRTVAGLNVRGLASAIPSLKSILESTLWLKRGERPDFLAVSETKEDEEAPHKTDIVGGYTYLSKPSKKRGNHGIGLFITNKLANQTTLKLTEEPNANIMWIQYVTSECIYYIASVYTPYGDKGEAAKVYEALKSNVAELSESGICIVLGDLNARCPSLTGDKNPRVKGGNTWKNGPALIPFGLVTEGTHVPIA